MKVEKSTSVSKSSLKLCVGQRLTPTEWIGISKPMEISELTVKTQELPSNQNPFRLIEGRELEVFIKRHERRRKHFIAEGLSDTEAYELAEKLWERDMFPELDDRRVCFECKHYNEKSTRCESIRDSIGAPTATMRFALQRCNSFEVKK